MSERERTDAGTFVETVTLDAVLGVFDAVRGPAITSTDVATHLDCSTEAARQKLTRLYDRGEVDKRKSGRTTLWWRTGGERITPEERAHEEDAESARERREHRAAGQAEGSPGERTDTTETAESDDTTDWMPDLREDLPGSGANLDGRWQAIQDIYEYLKEHGQGRRSDFKEVVNVEATGYTSFNSFYTNCTDNGALLAKLPGVESPGEGGHTYTYDP